MELKTVEEFADYKIRVFDLSKVAGGCWVVAGWLLGGW